MTCKVMVPCSRQESFPPEKRQVFFFLLFECCFCASQYHTHTLSLSPSFSLPHTRLHNRTSRTLNSSWTTFSRDEDGYSRITVCMYFTYLSFNHYIFLAPFSRCVLLPMMLTPSSPPPTLAPHPATRFLVVRWLVTFDGEVVFSAVDCAVVVVAAMECSVCHAPSSPPAADIRGRPVPIWRPELFRPRAAIWREISSIYI